MAIKRKKSISPKRNLIYQLHYVNKKIILDFVSPF
ncbi:MAG: hypothetical protein IEMM0008_0012 [bacterium]|nr:MAG: hypothetical protein IEMM0008_0012 [bacterium]